MFKVYYAYLVPHCRLKSMSFVQSLHLSFVPITFTRGFFSNFLELSIYHMYIHFLSAYDAFRWWMTDTYDQRRTTRRATDADIKGIVARLQRYAMMPG